MTRLIEFVISLVIVVVLFIVVGLALPSHAHVERSVELANPISQVFDVLNGFKRWNAWQPWVAIDPRAKYTREGPDFGNGARIKWSSWEKRVGNGTLEIVDSQPGKSIKMSLVNDWKGENKSYTINLDQSTQTNATTVTWAVDVDYGWNLIGRYAGLYLNGDVGETMATGLSRLSNLMATFPNVDYSQVQIDLVDVPAVNLLSIGDGVPAAPRKWDEAIAIMEKDWAEIEALMKKTKTDAAGPRRRTINVLGEENNDFNFSIPTAKPDVAVAGRVKETAGYTGKALTTVFHGHRVGLIKPRDMLKAYALSHGYKFHGELEGLWEEWQPAPDDAGQDVTTVYLPIEP